jgi:DNA-binding response OmpR family regulator
MALEGRYMEPSVTQGTLSYTPKSLNPTSLTGRVYALLDAHRGQWVDGREIAQVGGYAGWSARVRDLRKLGYVVEQQDYRVERDGRKFTVTEYRLL